MYLPAAQRWGACSAILAAWTGLLALGADVPPDPTQSEIAKRGREAVAYLELNPGSVGREAFCIHPSGLFVVLDAIVRSSTGDIKLVLNSGTPEHRVVAAKVILRDQEAGLALLRVEKAAGLAALPLGSADELKETMELITFRFPDVPVRDLRADQYPSISVNPVTIRALNRKHGQLESIHLIGKLFSGRYGPLLDAKGRVVGVQAGAADFEGNGTPGMEITQAVPVNVLERFLARPAIDFTPVSSAPVKKGQAVEFKASVLSAIPTTLPLNLQLVFAAGTPEERRVPMVQADGIYQTRAVPFPAPTGPDSVSIEVRYADGAVTGVTGDQSIAVGRQAVRLSKLRSLRLAPNPEARLADGELLAGTPVAPKAMTVTVGGQTIRLDLAKAIEIGMLDADPVDEVTCTLIARRGGDEVGRVSQPIYREGAAAGWGFDALRKGRFIRPPRSTTPVTYLRIESPPGDPIGQGKNYDSRNEKLSMSSNVPSPGYECGSSNWVLRLRPAAGRNLDVGEYRDAKRYSFDSLIDDTRDSPGIELQGSGRPPCRMITGEFRIWEMRNDSVGGLAVDFVVRCGEMMPPLVGMLRSNATFH